MIRDRESLPRMIRFEDINQFKEVPATEIGHVQAEHISHSWRRYLRFSVRGLITLVLVIGAGLAWWCKVPTFSAMRCGDSERGGSVSYNWERTGENSIPGGKP